MALSFSGSSISNNRPAEWLVNYRALIPPVSPTFVFIYDSILGNMVSNARITGEYWIGIDSEGHSLVLLKRYVGSCLEGLNKTKNNSE
jgi:hypothetical protein